MKKMNRCVVCDITDEDNPKAGISMFNHEPVCRHCQHAISENLEDLSLKDIDFELPELEIWLEANRD